MIPPEIQARLAHDAATEPERWWWLSFCDTSRPIGSQFVGCVIIQGRGIGWACRRAHELGINPGGECQGFEIPEARAEMIPERWRHRLLSRAECEQFDREMMS